MKLGSKRLWTTIIGIGAVIAVKYFGVPEDQVSPIVEAITKIVLGALAAFGAQDVVSAAKGAK